MRRELRLSDLSPARQRLTRKFQLINHGQVRYFNVLGGDPVFGPETVILLDLKLNDDDGCRPEIGLVDFNLSTEVCQLMRRLDELQDGQVESIDVRAGLPRRIVLRCWLGDEPR